MLENITEALQFGCHSNRSEKMSRHETRRELFEKLIRQTFAWRCTFRRSPPTSVGLYRAPRTWGYYFGPLSHKGILLK